MSTRLAQNRINLQRATWCCNQDEFTKADGRWIKLHTLKLSTRHLCINEIAALFRSNLWRLCIWKFNTGWGKANATLHFQPSSTLTTLILYFYSEVLTLFPRRTASFVVGRAERTLRLAAFLHTAKTVYLLIKSSLKTGCPGKNSCHSVFAAKHGGLQQNSCFMTAAQQQQHVTPIKQKPGTFSGKG